MNDGGVGASVVEASAIEGGASMKDRQGCEGGFWYGN